MINALAFSIQLCTEMHVNRITYVHDVFMIALCRSTVKQPAANVGHNITKMCVSIEGVAEGSQPVSSIGMLAVLDWRL